ncbi:DNA metabolism protein [Lithospermum erythrorhizon]|uniref:DNA metabolism protein n=1 Tax=Lithospermum erythrorhizon TaxID=34254 RepID=A0AAV3NSV1_LITER
MSTPKHTCLKLQVQNSTTPNRPEPVFVKGTWYPTRFDLLITSAQDSWTCHATEEEVEERAAQWDQKVSEYVDLAEKYLGFQQPGSVYGFADAGNVTCKKVAICVNHIGHWIVLIKENIVLEVSKVKKTLLWWLLKENIVLELSWTFEKEGTKLEWRWKCQPSPNSKKTTADILDFLLDANIRLSEEVVNKTQSFDRLKVEAEKCFAQSEKLSKEKEEFESEIFAKFVAVLNSKKAKLRELRDKLSRQGTGKKIAEDEEEEDQSSDKTVSYDESDEELPKKHAGTSKDVPVSKGRGRKRK